MMRLSCLELPKPSGNPPRGTPVTYGLTHLDEGIEFPPTGRGPGLLHVAVHQWVLRLFTAIDIPANIKVRLAALLDRLRPLAKLNWIRLEAPYHDEIHR